MEHTIRYFDHLMMARCLELAERGLGYSQTNPLVGCVVVKDGQIISEGWHKHFGGPHAEVEALEKIPDEVAQKCTLYVNLEPCCHYGKTPPCTNLLLKKKPARIVVAHEDPDQRVAGRGIQILKDAGIQVNLGILENQSKWLNRRYLTNKLKKRTYIILKWAETADGFMAGFPKRPIKITHPRDDMLVHWMRATEDAIMVGYQTALMDNPRLTVRHFDRRQPLRIVWDPEDTLPDHLHIKTDNLPTLIINKKQSQVIGNLRKVKFNGSISELTEYFLNQNISSILIEGGKKLLESFLNCNLWDEVLVFKTSNYIHEGYPSPYLPAETLQFIYKGYQAHIYHLIHESLYSRI